MQASQMGVINITPDSFSDGNLYNSEDSFAKKFQELSNWADIIDIGAESSAPMNNAISSSEEKARFETVFFPFLTKYAAPNITISIDTYKVDVFEYVARKINNYWPGVKVIFNDISGVVDEDLLDLLKDDSLYFDYVLSHNLVENRENASKHMDYCDNLMGNEFLESINQYFLERLLLLKDFSKRIMIDPCFGFSKTREQNHLLISKFNSFLKSIPSEYTIVYGISKKSFLRFPAGIDLSDKDNLTELEYIHSSLITQTIYENPQRHFIFRVHDSLALSAALKSCKILSFDC